MKKLFTLLLIITAICSCVEQNRSKQIRGATEHHDENKDTFQLSEVQLDTFNSKWLFSWKDNEKLQIERFEYEWTKNIELKWVKTEAISEHLRKYEEFFIPYEDLYLDLYSYGTVLNEKINGEYSIEFAVDSKVFLFNKKSSKRAEIVSVGSIEVIEDAIWIDGQQFQLLGYYDENSKTPFIWVFDIELNTWKSFKYFKAYDIPRVPYISLKYPEKIHLEFIEMD
jgi:hypothetical protein